MPYLQIRHRFWLIGGDELFLPGLFSVVGRFLWIIIIFFITYLDFRRLTGCTDSLMLLIYLIVSGSLFALAIFCDLSLVWISLRGTMIETYKRRSIGYLVVFRGFLVFIQLLCALLGVIGISLSQQIPCESDPERTDANKAILSIVVVSQLVDVLIQSCCCYMVSTNKVQLYGPDQGDEETQRKQFENNSQRFISSLQRSCCSPIAINPSQQNDSNNMEAVARVLTKLFHHDGFLDVVPSDVLAGMLLLRIEQRSKRRDASARTDSTGGAVARAGARGGGSGGVPRVLSVCAETKNDLFDSPDIKKDLHSIDTNSILLTNTPTTSAPSRSLTNNIQATRFRVNTIQTNVARRRYIATLPSGKLRPLREITSMPLRTQTIHRVSDTIAFAEDIDMVSNLLHYVKYTALMYTYITPLHNQCAIQACLRCQELYHTCHTSYTTKPGLELLCWCWFGSTRVSIPENREDKGGKGGLRVGKGGVGHLHPPSRPSPLVFNSSSRSPLPPFSAKNTPTDTNTPPPPTRSQPTLPNTPPLNSSPSLFAHTPPRTHTPYSPLSHGEQSTFHYYCAWNRSGLTNTHHEALPHTEMIAMSDRNDMVHKPYAVFLDHARQTVVIAIRGTVSLEDCITDILCDPVEMTAVGIQWGFTGEGRYAHGGMLRAAQVMRLELHESQVLQHVYGAKGRSDGGREVSDKKAELRVPLSRQFEHYGLVVTGHSLGAGAAVLLTILLRDEFPHVICYAYGTPAAVLDRKTCLDVREYVKSVILGNDIVSRLSLTSMSQLRNNVLDMICRAKVNKMAILTAVCRDLKAEDVLYDEREVPKSEFKDAVDQFKTACEAKLQTVRAESLFHPGHILHLVKSRTTHAPWKRPQHEFELLDTRCPPMKEGEGVQHMRSTQVNKDTNTRTSPRINKTYLAFSKSFDPNDKLSTGVGVDAGEDSEKIGVDMDNDMDNYTEIAISRSMVSDHMPDQYYDALYKLLCNYYAKV